MLLALSCPQITAAAEPTARATSGEAWVAGTEQLERDGTTLIYVPGGEFTLGSEDVVFSNVTQPVHRVHLSPFWIAKVPVTNDQYQRYLEQHPEHPKPEYWEDPDFNRPRQPVVGVGWHEADSYCRWAGLELPTEAQWEAAARGTEGRIYAWGNEEPTPELANYWDPDGKTSEVGSYPAGAGPYGTLDQAGNVLEWCADVWDRKAYEHRDGQTDPITTSGWENHYVVRGGGSWFYPQRYLPAATRITLPSEARYRSVGFRCARSAGGAP